jgi:hypothetical protein
MAGHNQSHQYPDPQQHHFQGSNNFSLTPVSLPRTEAAEGPAHSSISMSSGHLNEDPMLDLDDSSLAEFLQEIMTRGSPNFSQDATSMDFIPQSDGSWDVLNFGIDSSLEFNDMDLGWITSQNNQAAMFNYNTIPDVDDPPLDRGQQTPDVQSSINLGAEAFQKSLWNWLPSQREHGYLEIPNLSLPHKDMEGLENRAGPDIIDHQLEQSSRDAILAMVLNTHSQRSGILRVITSFPSAQLLNSLMHFFLISEAAKTDSWIHLPTFRPRTQIPEFNGIVIAAGAILSAVPTGIFPLMPFCFT